MFARINPKANLYCLYVTVKLDYWECLEDSIQRQTCMFSLNVFCREFLSRPPMENFVDDCKFAAADLSPVVFIFRLLPKNVKTLKRQIHRRQNR